MECISPGTTINHSYQVIKRIGSGVSGTVYQAHDIYSQKDVAIKVYSVEHQETFNNEMNVIMNLYNDFIIRCYGSFTEEGVGECLVMEYADGGSLLDTLKTFHSLPEEVVKKYIMSILIALSEIHSKNYIHSDIKAANILIKDGVPKLSDFGVSSTINDNTLKGSPYWMSPETVLGLPQTDKSDIWSIGALMIELLTGKPPFASHPTSVALMLLQGLEVPEIPEHVSINCQSFMMICLNPKAENRPTVRELLCHQWLNDDKDEYCVKFPEEYLYDLERDSYFNNSSFELSELFLSSEIHRNIFVELNGIEIVLKKLNDERFISCGTLLLKTLILFTNEIPFINLLNSLNEIICKYKNKLIIRINILILIDLLVINYKKINDEIDFDVYKEVIPFHIIILYKYYHLKEIEKHLFDICYYVKDYNKDLILKNVLEIDVNVKRSNALFDFFTIKFGDYIDESLIAALNIINVSAQNGIIIPQMIYIFMNYNLFNVSNEINVLLIEIFKNVSNSKIIIYNKETIEQIWNNIKNIKMFVNEFINFLNVKSNDVSFRNEFIKIKCFNEIFSYLQINENFPINLYLTNNKNVLMDLIPKVNSSNSKIFSDFLNDNNGNILILKCFSKVFHKITYSNHETADFMCGFHLIFTGDASISCYYITSKYFRLYIQNLTNKSDTSILKFHLLIILQFILIRPNTNTFTQLLQPMLKLKRQYNEHNKLISQIISLICK